MLRVLLAALPAAAAAGISQKYVVANGLKFSCRFAGESGTSGDVMLLHGFPEWSSMYEGVMGSLAEHGYRSVACDQRGYSRGASPSSKADYSYHKLQDDIWAVADAVGFKRFHLVAHDHGAVLGWWTAGTEVAKQRLLSYSAMSIPHLDAFSEGLQGDKEQQMASQYFTMFVLPDSASIHFYFWYLALGVGSGFGSASDFQKALWWYNGAFDVGVLAMPPLMSRKALSDGGYSGMSFMRSIFGGEPDDGAPQKVHTGNISVPVLYACGSSDGTILCDRPFARKTAQYCEADYQHLVVNCGHSLLDSGCGDREKVAQAIVHRVMTADKPGLDSNLADKPGLDSNLVV